MILRRFMIVLAVGLLSAAQVSGRQMQLDDMPITVDPAQYERDCRPVHSLLIDSDYQAAMAAPNLELDENGVVITDYSNRDAGWQVVPVTLGMIGLSGAYAWCEHGDVTGLQLAVNQARWLAENGQVVGDFITWPYPFPNPSFFAPAGWTSGLGNGQAIALLTQVYLLSGEGHYLDAAQKAVQSFRVDISEGGVRSTLSDGSVVYEEVAHPDAPASYILNGHMIAVDGLAFYADASGDTAAAELVNAGIQSVKNHLEDFDASVTSYYSLGPIPWGSARTHYAHGIHIRGLFWMYARTNDPVFLRYAFDWQRYKWPPITADLYRNIISVDTLMAQQPETHRWLVEPADTQAVILDLLEAQTVRSFGFNMVGPYPSEFTIETSLDGENWTTVATEGGYTGRHGLYMLDGEARYIRLSFGAFVRDNPYYNLISNGAYQDYILIGVVRADGAAYWEEPTLLVTDGLTDYDDAQYLRDGSTDTTLPLPASAVLYADLRAVTQVTQIEIAAAPESGQITRRAWVEVSDDMQNWTSLVGENEAITASLPGVIPLPESDQPYRYLRVHLDGDEPLTMTEVTIR